MIPALFEGVTQSLLPCSWTVLLPAIAIGVGTRNLRVYGVFAAGLVVAAWAMASGWLVPPLWVAGIGLLVGAVLWWGQGISWVSAALVGIGAAWAWRPCVGPELGEALTTAAREPFAAFGGLTMFLLGLVGVGLAVGIGIAMLIERRNDSTSSRAGAVVAGILGLTMIVGLYPSIASTFARWSYELWA